MPAHYGRQPSPLSHADVRLPHSLPDRRYPDAASFYGDEAPHPVGSADLDAQPAGHSCDLHSSDLGSHNAPIGSTHLASDAHTRSTDRYASGH